MSMTVMGAKILPFLATYLVHSTLLLGGAWALGRFLLRGDAWRETLWKTALAGGLVTALVAQVAPSVPGRIDIPVRDSGPFVRHSGPFVLEVDAAGAAEAEGSQQAEGSPARLADRGSSTASSAAGTGVAAGVGRRADAGRAAGLPWPALILLAWTAVAAVLLARLAGRRWRFARLLRSRRQVLDPGTASTLAGLRRAAGVWQPVRLTCSSSISSPVVLGHREICVPERFLTELGPAEQRAALAHELAHLARRDPAWLMAAMLLERVFFFQPLHRVARRGLRETAEFLADAWAVRLSGGRLDLARCLAEVAAWVGPPGEPRLDETMAMTEGGSPLLCRVRRLLEGEPAREPRAWPRRVAAIALIGAVAGFAPAMTPKDSASPAREGRMAENGAADVPGTDRATDTGGVADAGADAGAPRRLAANSSNAQAPSNALAPSNERALSNEQAPSTDQALSTEQVLLNEQAVTNEQAPSTEQALSVVRAPAEGDLAERMAWAEAHASSRGAPAHWVAWAVPGALPMDAHVTTDSGSGIGIWVTDEPDPALRRMRGGAWPAARGLGVLEEIRSDGDGYDILILARRDGSAGGARVDRLAASSPVMPLQISGPVYWLGRVDAEESLRWHERLLETVSDLRVADLAIEAASLHAGPETSRFLRSLAADGDARRDAREEAVEGLALHPADENLDFLVRMAGTDGDVVMRAEAVETLGELRHPGAPDALRGFLGAGDADVRSEALESLSEQVRDTALVATLLQVAMSDPHPDLRREAVELLGELPSAEAVPALRRVLAESTDADVLRQVAEELGEVGTTEALAALDEVIATSPNPDVVLEAIEAVADGYPAAEARQRLEEISRSHDSGDVRSEAVEELMDMYVADGSSDVLLEMALGDQDPDLRRDAVERIGDLPAAEAVPLLRRVAFESSDESAQRQAAESLGEVGTPEALAVLDEIVEGDLGDEVGTQAVGSIAEGFSRDLALPRLRRILTDHPSIRVRREALERLADLGG